MGSANVTLYAQWTTAPTYTVTYAGNGAYGGSVPVDSTNYLQGATVTVLINTGNLVRTGYSFGGWNTQADGNGTSYTPGQNFTMGSANVTLYAQWAPTYTVSYNGNQATGGSVPVDNTNYLQGATATVLGNTGNLVRTGYSFSGWNTQANGSETAYTPGQSLTMSRANVTLYAQWAALPTYTVSYNGNGNTGGAVPTDSNAYVQGATVTVLGNTGNLVKTGNSFVGWNSQADGNGITYPAGQSFTIGYTNVVLYAMWTTLPTYTVSYNGNGNTGGAVPTDSNAYVQGATVTVLGNIGSLVKTNYNFSGWNTAANGSGETYTQGSTFSMGSANVTLYAQWTTLSTYTVNYNGNGNTGGSVPTDSTNYLQGATVTVLGNTGNLSKLGYSFIGWNPQADGSGTTYTQGLTFTMGGSNVTLYAKWAPTYTVAYNANGATGGTVPTDSASYLPGSSVTVLGNTGNLVRTYFTFEGWNSQADGNGTTYAESQTFIMGSANVILYAKWNPVPRYMVTYSGNGNTGGSAPTDPNTYPQGATVTVLGSGSLTKTGYAFVEWNTVAKGGGTPYTANQTFAMGGSNVFLYARWAALITTVAGNGDAADSGDGGSATAARLYNPSGVAVSSAGVLYISDYANCRVRKVISGIINPYAGNGTVGFSGDGLAATTAALNGPWGIALDSSSNLYIADTYNNRIRKVTAGTTPTINTFAGSGTPPNNYGYAGDDVDATSAMLYYARAVVLDAAGNLYIADTYNHVVRKVNTSGKITRVAGTPEVNGYFGDGGSATDAKLYYPWGVAVDGNGNLFIADSANSCIRRVSSSGIIATVVGIAVAGYSGDGGPATSAQINGPMGIAFDVVGNLYIAEYYNHRIRRVDTNGIITTVAGNGTAGYSGDGVPATSASLNYPRAVAIDAAGYLYIADTMNNRIRKVSPP
jgi:uncharacterized repeat protein (TIGR02543 family)